LLEKQNVGIWTPKASNILNLDNFAVKKERKALQKIPVRIYRMQYTSTDIRLLTNGTTNTSAGSRRWYRNI